MELRIVKCIFPQSETYYITQRKIFGLFWVTFNWQWCSVTCIDKVAIDYKSYRKALKAIKNNLNNNLKKRKKYYYIDSKELLTNA